MTKLCDFCGREMLHPCGQENCEEHPLWCPATPDQHRIAELEKQLEEERHRVTCAGKHGHNPQILDCPKCVEEERDEALTQLRAREAEVLALRGALVKTARRLNAKGYNMVDGTRAALSNTSATAQEIVARIERAALEKVIKAVCTQGHNFEVFLPEHGAPYFRESSLREGLVAILGEKTK